MSPDRDPGRRVAAAIGGYILLALAFTWPLPLHLRTALLADPSTDVGVYVWNLWVFRHEILAHGHLPVSTGHVFAYTGGADFSLHNFTPLGGALAAPLIGVTGVVGAFNILLVAFLALSGFGTWLLARRLRLAPAAAWSAGALFMASPVMMAKATQHFSLVMAAPLPLFVWALFGALERQRPRDGAVVGLMVAAASYSDAYYPVYCVLMGTVIVAARFLRLDWRGRARGTWLPRALTVLLVLLGTGLGWRAISGGTTLELGPVRIGLQTLYTPVLVLTLVAAGRAWLAWRPTFALRPDRPRLAALVGPGLVAVATCLILVAPQLVGLAGAAMAGRLPEVEIFWRSSPRGVDALGFLVPNPNHPWFGAFTRSWLMPERADAYPEFVASFPLAAFALIALAGFRALPRVWLAFTACFALLALGPFVHLAGVNTFVPGPWALLRFVPIVGMARSPARFAIVASLGLALLFAFALEVHRRRRRAASPAATIVLAAALLFELVPLPRPLYSAAIPDVYRRIQADGDEAGRLLDLPTGIRDGTSSLGDFTAASQYYQTLHGRPLVGGYLSRVAEWRKDEALASPMLRALFALAEGRDVSAELVGEARAARVQFLQRSCVRYVVLHKRRASEALRAFAADALRIEPVAEDASYALLVPADPPPCG